MAQPATFPITVTLPHLFYKDHLGRDCGHTGKVIKETKTTFEVILDELAWDDIYSDCEVYVAMIGTQDYEENKSYIQAAVRTLARLNKAIA